jgi:hypothetical protein
MIFFEFILTFFYNRDTMAYMNLKGVCFPENQALSDCTGMIPVASFALVNSAVEYTPPRLCQK